MSDTTYDILRVIPLVILVVISTVVIFRGMSRKSDDTINRAKGGGLSNSDHYWGGGSH